IIRKGAPVHGKTMVHGNDFDLVRRKILDRMIGSVVTLMHLDRPRADRQRHHLMAEANPESRYPAIKEDLNRRDSVFAGFGRVTWAIGEENPIRLERENIFRAR